MKDQSPNIKGLKFELISNFNQHKSSTSIQRGSQQKTYLMNLKSAVSILERTWNWFIKWLLSSDELKICILKNRFGETFWSIHDRHTGRSMSFDSEAEVRAWLDRRFY